VEQLTLLHCAWATALRDELVLTHPAQPLLQRFRLETLLLRMPVLAHLGDDFLVARRAAIDQEIVPGGEQRGDDFGFFGGPVCEESGGSGTRRDPMWLWFTVF
jgi:hypothetical protein